MLPMSRDEMDVLGWDACDVVLVTGDAYVDHPSFGAAVIGRVLLAHGYRVGIIAQPDWHSAEAFITLGKPKLFFGVTAGNLDSMVNHYTSERRIRSDDAYSPDGAADKRPDRAVLVYAQRCREAFRDIPVVLGGIEASLRRFAHYDYWSDKVRRSILFDAKADLLLYGNAERAVLEVARQLSAGTPIAEIKQVRGSARALREPLPDVFEIDGTLPNASLAYRKEPSFIRMPSYEDVCNNPVSFAHASRLIELESNPGNARALVQAHGDRLLWVNPPPLPLSTAELDTIYELDYSRRPHLSYGKAKIPAYDMIRSSVTIMRGCFGGCSFCSLFAHEGAVVQSRSEASVLRELEEVRDRTPGFAGVISDLGGPTANMFHMGCRDPDIQGVCRRPSCLWPKICKNLETDHSRLLSLYRRAREVSGIKKVLVASGVRFDVAVRSPKWIAELAEHHTGGRLKIAPEHSEAGPLDMMRKPGIATYDHFAEMFLQASRRAGRKQFLVPYFIAAHPGTTDEDMLHLALWLKRQDLQVDQVQSFLPSPMTAATTMYHTGLDPRTPLTRPKTVTTARGGRQRRLHMALLRYHDSKGWPLIREALVKMGRLDLIGHGPEHLVPPGLSDNTGGKGRHH
ncbi:MAG: YgiQ family radical SAM protein [Deltaproteobacteria bacterium RIFOXYA12_FULL_58_15]|nr:MAG: YgiQ family radical SAM protein [Deltaproteobacteria bacterium RIFOXYA12_FULL_58_15]OGR13304.1 MAG: YgiQ family radical SAM protein [Deltaproteobacteria bacterium RIFOXYB12_FULL_58_9]